MVALIFGIIWLIKGEIKIRRTPWWDERIIRPSNGRFLGAMMVIGSLCPVPGLLPSEVAWIYGLIVVLLPLVLGVAMAEKL